MEKYSCKKIKFIYELAVNYMHDPYYGDIYHKELIGWMLKSMTKNDNLRVVKYVTLGMNKSMKTVNVEEPFKGEKFFELIKKENLEEEFEKL